jgi:branched-chain amino acid transport system ATP-binding protein
MTSDPVGTLMVEDIVSGYRSGPAVVSGVSLTVAPGEVVAVLGRNGAGKSTLLRTISGVLRCRQGAISLGGRHLSGMSPWRIAGAGVAHVPEGRRVIPGMSVEDNLRLGGYTLKKRAAVDAQLSTILAAFPMLEKWRRRVAGSLSGGEQQMLAIARALMSAPKIVLLDEPLTGLAPIYRSQVLGVVDDMRRAGQGILIVEQNAVETLPVADRALIVHEGRITLTGPAKELVDSAATQEEYLGLPVGASSGVRGSSNEERST